MTAKFITFFFTIKTN